MKSNFKFPNKFTKLFIGLAVVALVASCATVRQRAADLGPGFTQVKEGIYTFAPDATTTTCSFVVTNEGVVMIDACNSPLQSRNMLGLTAIIPATILFFRRQRRSLTLKVQERG